MPCEGRIETAPQTGATWLEPNRKRFGGRVQSLGEHVSDDSPAGDGARDSGWGRLPGGGRVEKELEDLPRPEHATAGSATFRITDGSLPSRRTQEATRTRSSPCWIPLGRDPPLEQRMLAEIHARLAGITTAANPSLLP